MPIDPKININENQVIFKRTGGHVHDGLSSSLIDYTKYSIFDFVVHPVAPTGSSRRNFQETNVRNLQSFIVNTIEARYLNPAGVRIQANAITAREIVSGTITSDELAANIILVNNVIRSNNFDGTINSNGGIVAYGNAGWAITHSGLATFNNVFIRGGIAANTGSIGGVIISGSSIYTSDYDSNNGFALYANGFADFNEVSVRGEVIATSGSIGGIILNSGAMYSSNYNSAANTGFAIFADGSADFNNVNIRGIVEASGGSIGSYTISGGSLTASGSGSVGMADSWSSSIVLNTSAAISTNTYYIDGINGFGFHNVITFNDVGSPEGGIKVERGVYNAAFTYMFSYAGYRYGPLGPQNLSDERLKNILDKESNALNILNKIQIVPFTYKNDGFNSEKLGFIAQQLHTVLPDMVITGGENPEERPWTVVMEQIIPYLTKAIQELSQRNDGLEDRLQTLEGV